MHDLHDTIVALSSAPGPGGRAIVRLSGPNAVSLLQPLFTPAAPLEKKRRRWEGDLRLEGIHSPLPADLYLWPAPHSLTGQEVVELHTLSCPPLIELLIASLLRAGARAARPGEFTLRGFLAGKLDLTRAEATLGVIEAGSRAELKQALAQLAGGVTRPLEELRNDLLDLLADVEAGLDFSEEDLHFVKQPELLKRLAKGLALVTLIGKQLEQRSAGEGPFRVVLVGRPNVGKSSLFNALGGVALVSAEAGTTRDYLTQRLEIEGTVIELVDTAGWHSPNGAIETQAQELGREQAGRADLLLLCLEAGAGLSAEEGELLRRKEPPVVAVATKCDQAQALPEALPTSAVTGSGLEKLRALLAGRARSYARPALAPSLGRCRHHVAACLEHLRRAHSAALFSDPAEILALDLRGALDQLGEMVGAVYTDDLLDRIFSRFCIGK